MPSVAPPIADNATRPAPAAGAVASGPPMRARITTVYGALAMLWALAVVVQVFLAGLGIFGAASFDAHRSFGFALHAVTALLAILAIAGPRTGRDIGMAVGLLVLVTVQIALVGSRDSAQGLAA